MRQLRQPGCSVSVGSPRGGVAESRGRSLHPAARCTLDSVRSIAELWGSLKQKSGKCEVISHSDPFCTSRRSCFIMLCTSCCVLFSEFHELSLFGFGFLHGAPVKDVKVDSMPMEVAGCCRCVGCSILLRI